MHFGLKKKKKIIRRRRKLDYKELFRFAKTALRTSGSSQFEHRDFMLDGMDCKLCGLLIATATCQVKLMV